VGASEPPRRPGRVVAAICVLGVVLTVLASWLTARVDANTEERLLEVQTRQAATVLSTAVFIIQQPLRTALDVQAVASPAGDTIEFRNIIGPYVGDDDASLFVTASLWRRGPDGLTRLAPPVGAPPALPPGDAETRALLDRAFDSATFVVELAEDQDRIAYALADAETGLVIKAEAALPADRRASEDSDEVFADIDYAIYVGEDTDASGLTTTDVDPDELPLDGRTYTTTVPFGDTVITLVATPRHHLGSALSQRLPLILLLGGLLLTAAAALVARKLVRSRTAAEDNAGTITALYERVDTLYEEQRALALRLQQALLPQANPDIPGLEIATDYVAGAQGVDIGGDWYSAIRVGADEFAFVVGDVSGHGVDAVAVMARARFTLRAYLLDGNPPQLALEKASRQFDVALDEHMITALVGVGNWRTGEITLATAGHPPPLLVDELGSEYVDLPVGPPLGIGTSTYAPASVTMPAGSTLVAYTDGLVERRSEPIDVGLRRLAQVVEPLAGVPVDELVSRVVTSMRDEQAVDDIAVLVLRRPAP
jgi:serine phosphatase RsbU (regulator of sigma subunit)/type II secretory pathway pseudopilin PulG